MPPIPRPRLLRRLGLIWRRPRWSTVAALAVYGGLVALLVPAGGAPSVAPSGRPVLVATTAIEPGDTVRADDVARVLVPDALGAPALSALEDPTVAVEPIDVGEVVTQRKVASGSGSDRALRPDERGVAVRTFGRAAPFDVGDRVEVIVSLDAYTNDTPPLRVEHARVVETADDVVIVAVPVDVAAEVALATEVGTVTLVLAP